MRLKLQLGMMIGLMGLGATVLAQHAPKSGVLVYEMRNYPPVAFARFSDKVSHKVTDSLVSPIHVYFKEGWTRYVDSLVTANQDQAKQGSPYYSGTSGWLASDQMLYVFNQFKGKSYYSEEAISDNSWRFALTMKNNPEYDGVSVKAEVPFFKMNDPKNLTITDETKEIWGYKCHKAIYETRITTVDGSGDDGKIVFWFTDEIPYPISPIPCNLVKGAVLELVSHRVLYVVKRFEYAEPHPSVFAIPQDGRKISIKEEEARIISEIKEVDTDEAKRSKKK